MSEEPAAALWAALFAVTCGSLAYVGLMHASSGLWYLPLTRAWALGPQPPTLAMAWFGHTLAVLMFAAVGALVGHGAARRSTRALRVLAAVAAASMLVAVSICIAQSIDRPTTPIPLPSGQPVLCDPVQASAARMRVESETQPKMPPWALIIFRPISWNSGKYEPQQSPATMQR